MSPSVHRERLRTGPDRRTRGRRGNAMVEFCIVFLPLMALLVAIVDFSMPIFLRCTFTHAVREGSRYGITFQTVSGLSQTDSIKRVVQQNAMGFLAGTSGLSQIAVRYYLPTGTFSQVTGPGANADGNIVEVTIQNYNWTWIAPIWRGANPLSITVSSSNRLETLPRNLTRPTP
jgi:Flp pilus assembly protein TadG